MELLDYASSAIVSRLFLFEVMRCKGTWWKRFKTAVTSYREKRLLNLETQWMVLSEQVDATSSKSTLKRNRVMNQTATMCAGCYTGKQESVVGLGPLYGDLCHGSTVHHGYCWWYKNSRLVCLSTSLPYDYRHVGSFSNRICSVRFECSDDFQSSPGDQLHERWVVLKLSHYSITLILR